MPSPRGLGIAMARPFAEHGRLVAILDLNIGAVQAVVAEIGSEHIGLACDVTDEQTRVAAASE
jgi:NAD(P)-dependent dehydrogenase (short-subunit alcohol dehydrogenase family)